MPVRIDKYLWAVRLFKTRSLASETIKKGKVNIAGHNVKPSRIVQAGDTFEIRSPMLVRKFRVVATLNNRVGAKLVAEYLKETTPTAELEAYEQHRKIAHMQRHKGLGRPTKKDRRELDKLNDEADNDYDWDDL